MRRLQPIAGAFLLMTTFACAGVGRTGASGLQGAAPADLPRAMEALARQAETAADQSERFAAAERAMRLGAACVRHHPTHPGCYYYRAVTTGFYYQVKVIGYQRGIHQMLADGRAVLALDPAFAHAGAHRMLGQLYTQLPKTTIHPTDIVRDLEQAKAHLLQAVAIAPTYPENHLALCEAYLADDDPHGARPACDRAHALAARWPVAVDRQAWLAAVGRLKERLAKRDQ